MDDYTVINPTAELDAARHDNARASEVEAKTLELEAEQWRRVIDAGDERPGIRQNLIGVIERAELARARATAAHALAGTTSADFAIEIRKRLRDNLFSMETQLVRLADELEHPEAYAPSNVPVEQWTSDRRYSVKELVAGTQVLREELDAYSDVADADEAETPHVH